MRVQNGEEQTLLIGEWQPNGMLLCLDSVQLVLMDLISC